MTGVLSVYPCLPSDHHNGFRMWDMLTPKNFVEHYGLSSVQSFPRGLLVELLLRNYMARKTRDCLKGANQTGDPGNTYKLL